MIQCIKNKEKEQQTIVTYLDATDMREYMAKIATKRKQDTIIFMMFFAAIKDKFLVKVFNRRCCLTVEMSKFIGRERSFRMSILRCCCCGAQKDRRCGCCSAVSSNSVLFSAVTGPYVHQRSPIRNAFYSMDITKTERAVACRLHQEYIGCG